jgi:2-polyprenyl-6-methoxyphenol hydroxylase-like FAD-dependent oxidoreductase
LPERNAEVIGAGLVGLATAAVLGKQGWKVRVHERAQELREVGAGIILWGNALRSLRYVGALDDVLSTAQRVENAELRGEEHEVIRAQWLQNSEMYSVARGDLHAALVKAARGLGVEIVNGSYATAADPSGTVTFADGTTIAADLVIGADGVHSRVRDSLNLARRIINLEDGCGRYLIDRTADDGLGHNIEEWHGGRRFGLVPCRPDKTYIFLCCPASDLDGRSQQPFKRKVWLDDYPHFRSQLERIPDRSDARWAPFYDVDCVSWVSGRVAILGDAAHAMSPNLGMAVCVAMTNAVALGEALAAEADVPTALGNWETSERPVADRVQRYSRLYGKVGTNWPRSLVPLRTAIVKAIGRSRTLQAKINFASEYKPRIAPHVFDFETGPSSL